MASASSPSKQDSSEPSIDDRIKREEEEIRRKAIEELVNQLATLEYNQRIKDEQEREVLRQKDEERIARFKQRAIEIERESVLAETQERQRSQRDLERKRALAEEKRRAAMQKQAVQKLDALRHMHRSPSSPSSTLISKHQEEEVEQGAVLSITIELGNGQSDTIEYCAGHDPQVLAADFCRKHELDPSVFENAIADTIRSNLPNIAAAPSSQSSVVSSSFCGSFRKSVENSPRRSKYSPHLKS